MKEIFLRMVIGGSLVSAFAALGDVFKPKRFAGLFGAAPSVALATLALTAQTQGKFTLTRGVGNLAESGKRITSTGYPDSHFCSSRERFAERGYIAPIQT